MKTPKINKNAIMDSGWNALLQECNDLKPLISNKKYMSLLKSPRFLGIVAVGILQGLVLFNIITSVQGEGLVLIVQSIIASAILVGSLDRVGKQAQ